LQIANALLRKNYANPFGHKNAGKTNVRLTCLKAGGYGTNRNSLSTEKVTQYILGKGLEKVPYKPHCVRLVTNKNNCNVKGIAEGRLK